MFTCTTHYSYVRGFNFQPDWGAHGITIWLHFDSERYRELVRNAKKKFPRVNTLRIWLSFDAWCEDPDTYLRNVKTAGDILTEEGLAIIPVYFNGWFGIPSFGGFVPETLGWLNFQDPELPYAAYIKETAAQLRQSAVLVHDISNEPLNNTFGNAQAIRCVSTFLQEMISVLRRADSRPVTVGSQGFLIGPGDTSDIEEFAPFVDVISLHPYNINGVSPSQHREWVQGLLTLVEKTGKPCLITECCWGAATARERLPFLQSELPIYRELGIGFCAHALCTSPVADLHPADTGRKLGAGLYMAFLDDHGDIRPGHELFNDIDIEIE